MFTENVNSVLRDIENEVPIFVGSDDVSTMLSEPGDSFNSIDLLRTEGRLFLVPCLSPFLLALESQPLKFIVREPKGSLLFPFVAVEGRARHGMPAGVLPFVDPRTVVKDTGRSGTHGDDFVAVPEIHRGVPMEASVDTEQDEGCNE